MSLFSRQEDTTMRKIFISAAFFCLAATLSASGVTGKITATSLNLRIQPTLKASVAGKIKNGQEITITGRKGSWLEIIAPESVKVYISEAYISGGKVITDIAMYAGMSVKAPKLGIITKGTEVKSLNERKWGWIRIAPPANLKVYAAATYVDYDKEAVDKLVSAATEVKKADAKQEVKAEVKKTDAKAEAKQEVKAEVKKTDAEAEVKKADAKQEVKAEIKPVAKPAAVSREIRPDDPRVQALKAYNIDVLKAKPETVTLQGVMLRIPDSRNIATNFALGSVKGQNLGFICVEAEGMVSPFLDQQVKITGRKFQVKGWKAPIIWLDEIDRIK